MRPRGKASAWRTVGVNLVGVLVAITVAQAQADPTHTAQPPPSSAPEPNTGTTSADHARELIRDGHYSDASALARDLLVQEETRSGPDSLQVAEILDIIVEADRLGGKVKDAGTRELARRAIRIKEGALGADHPDVARSVNNLANLLVESGDYVGAKPLYERVVSIQDRK